MHNLAIYTRFNGIDIDQMKDYVKLHSTKYLTKMLQIHPWAFDRTYGKTPYTIPI